MDTAPNPESIDTTIPDPPLPPAVPELPAKIQARRLLNMTPERLRDHVVALQSMLAATHDAAVTREIALRVRVSQVVQARRQRDEARAEAAKLRPLLETVRARVLDFRNALRTVGEPYAELFVQLDAADLAESYADRDSALRAARKALRRLAKPMGLVDDTAKAVAEACAQGDLPLMSSLILGGLAMTGLAAYFLLGRKFKPTP